MPFEAMFQCVFFFQARPDRDKYVEIIEENISPRYKPDFDKVNRTLINSRGYPYDYRSIMHYSERTFTNTGGKTIKVRNDLIWRKPCPRRRGRRYLE